MSARTDADKLAESDVEAVRAVSAGRAKLLGKLGIRSASDLLTCYPKRYIDLSETSSCAGARVGQTVTVVGSVHEVVEKNPSPRMSILEVTLVDDTGMLLGVWFRQPWMAKRFNAGARVAFSGKVGFDYGYKRMNSPFVEFLDAADSQSPSMPFVPVHPATEGLSTTWMRRFAANALEQCSDITDPLPARLRLARQLMSKKAALRGMHFPRSAQERDAARRRLAYEELLCLQLKMMRRRDAQMRGSRPCEHRSGSAVGALRTALPFTLTDEQESSVADILADMSARRCMNRMLLGDVGTGKTVVAAFAIASCADTGTQCAMMAPTEVLARQYAEKLGPLLDAAQVSWGVLTGSTPPAERERILEAARTGGTCCLFGTHALIEPGLVFAKLTLVIIDEQHRFGVSQRAALRSKGEGSDLLLMTATPIPRTLALALYGDLETSYIRKRPANRPATVTRVVSRDQRGIAYDAIREAVAAGRQAYIICPLVGLTREQRAKRAEDGRMADALAGRGDISDAKAAADEAAFLAAKVFPQFSVGLLTGHMPAAEKQQAMEDFASGKTQVLVATTVVEVGIDVPNATVMMVEDAERFGLSQLHQLRGRVGRGQHEGRFFLVADPGKDDDELRARMDALVSSDDGFELAQADLAARREGDVLGLRQHGEAVLKLVNVVDDAELVEQAHADARAILDADPQLAGAQLAALAHELDRMFAQETQEEGER